MAAHSDYAMCYKYKYGIVNFVFSLLVFFFFFLSVNFFLIAPLSACLLVPFYCSWSQTLSFTLIKYFLLLNGAQISNTLNII